MRVLHVSEAMGGGTVSAILAMVEATPELDHHLYVRPRPGRDTAADLGPSFGSVHPMPDNPVTAAWGLRRLCRELYPELVHAHSSIGGVVARVIPTRARVVYSPHCFAFERRDVGHVPRRLYATAERCLVPRTDLLLAVTPDEVTSAARLGHRAAAYVPNRALDPGLPLARHRTPLRIVTAGRLCRQKDWRYFLHAKRYAEHQFGIEASWEWLGGGSRQDEYELERAGVSVTGWLPQDALLRRLSRAQVYVHTAAWEAAPISILEAAAVGLPLVVRAIEPLHGLELPGSVRSVPALGQALRRLQARGSWHQAQQDSLHLAARHSRALQAEALRAAYARVWPTPTDPPAPSEPPAPRGPLTDPVVTPRLLADGHCVIEPSAAVVRGGRG